MLFAINCTGSALMATELIDGFHDCCECKCTVPEHGRLRQRHMVEISCCLLPISLYADPKKKKKPPAISDRFADSLQRKRQSLQLERNRSRLRCFKANLYEQQSLMYVSEATGLRARYGINGASLRAL